MGRPRALRLVAEALALGRLRLLHGALGQDLLDHGVLVAGAKLVLERALGGGVEGALGTLAVGGKDLEGRDEVGEGHGGVLEPLLVVVDVVDEDDKVLVGALEVDLCLGSLAASHFGCVGGGGGGGDGGGR